MERELQRLLDEAAIRGVAIRYCRAIDQCDWAALGEVFTPDATAWLGSDPVINGLDGIRQRVSSALDPLDGSQHIVGNHEVTIEGDDASHQCYFQAQHIRRSADGGSLYIVAGRYVDRLRRGDDGWRIVHRRLEVMWTEGNTAVLHKPT